MLRRKYGENAKFSMGYMCIFAVTPLAGVGIEMDFCSRAGITEAIVTPLAGVGIEIAVQGKAGVKELSPPSRG